MSDSKDRELFEAWYGSGYNETLKSHYLRRDENDCYLTNRCKSDYRSFLAGLEAARKEAKKIADNVEGCTGGELVFMDNGEERENER